jgi:hypothetical protein
LPERDFAEGGMHALQGQLTRQQAELFESLLEVSLVWHQSIAPRRLWVILTTA